MQIPNCKSCGKSATAAHDDEECVIKIWLIENDDEIAWFACSCGGTSDRLTVEQQMSIMPMRYMLYDLRGKAHATN